MTACAVLVACSVLSGCVFYDTGAVKLNAGGADTDLVDTRDPADADEPADASGDIGRDDGVDCDAGACCEPESDLQFCDRLVLTCGEVTAEDNCGAPRTIDCGVCTPPATCGGGGTDNVCACPSQTDADFCALNAECGPVTGVDACGQMRTVDCGSCAAPETCGGSGMSGICGCAVESDIVFCSRQNACGLLTANDNCELPRSADCGICGEGTTCQANVCECAPETNVAFCARLNACETLTAVDNCNVARTVDCGACAGGEACVNRQCACTPEDDATFCARLGSACGERSGNDNCAMARTVASCGTCSGAESCNAGVCDAAFPPAGIEVWLRSDEGITLNAQSKVLTWADRLTADAWTPVAPNDRPTMITGGPGGFDRLRFFGGQRLSQLGGTFASMTFTAFVVGARNDTTREGAILGVHGTSAAADHELAYGTTETTMRFASASGLSYSATVLSTASTQVLTFRADGTNFEFYQGTVLTASTPHVPTSNFEFDSLGSFRFSDGLVADVQEVMIWPRALSAAERTAVVGYLKSRYNL